MPTASYIARIQTPDGTIHGITGDVGRPGGGPITDEQICIFAVEEFASTQGLAPQQCRITQFSVVTRED
ncbi:hypothetical protein [Actinacidiphila yeochonensis]|uniref:hypothetical protein n=1 Tax=Actinacidiphila yeochonensis TaxID=89050 RepID=UPI000563CEBA|nr:hypothetical protein [Actinacidiphila yeochonensis]